MYYLHTDPQKPGISFVGCNGTSPIVRVTRPPNFNGLVELDYNFSTDGMPNGQVGDGTYMYID